MRRRLLVTLSLFTFFVRLPAQEKLLLKPTFHSVEQIALVNGNDAVSGALQSLNGLSYGNWFAGIGAGLDFYRYRSLPFFLDMRRTFALKNGNRLFVYADAGYNIPWIKRKDPAYNIWGWPNNLEYKHKYTGGPYMDAGFGYAVRFGRGNALLLSVGYSHKYFSERQTTITRLTENRNQVDIQRFTYSMNRLMIKTGWQF